MDKQDKRVIFITSTSNKTKEESMQIWWEIIKNRLEKKYGKIVYVNKSED